MRNVLLVFLCAALLACETSAGTEAAPLPIETTDAGANADGSVTDVIPAADAAPTCEQRIAERAFEAPTSRQAAYQRALPEVLVHARVDPVLFLAWPDARPRTASAAALRAALEASRHASRDVRRLITGTRDRALLREVLLSDGYLFSDRPRFAVALSAAVNLTDLFDAPHVYRARDGVIDVLEREGESYLELDGSIARLRLNDRVSEDESALTGPLGLELEAVREQSGALRTIPTAIGTGGAAMDLVFPDDSRRPALVELREGSTEVVCIGGATSTLEVTRLDAQRFWARHAALVSAATALVEESPRFDEPTDEPEGVQEDGALRPAWALAYLGGESTFTYGTVEYPVFDRRGRALPPEVCIDFVFDAWERGEGTWYRGARQEPGRTQGALDPWQDGAIPRRSLTSLLDYAEGEDSILDRYDVPSENRVALTEGPEYAQAVARTADAFREGDALVIYGLREQDMRMHHHALLVIRTDPMTGVPMVVADNQGRPHFRSLVSAMQAAPLRAIHHRLRRP